VKILEKIKNVRLKGSIKGRLILYFALLVIIPFLMIGAMAYQSENSALRERIRSHLTSIADIQKSRIESWLSERSSDVNFLVKNKKTISDVAFLERYPDSKNYLNTDQYNELKDNLSDITYNHAYLRASIVDKNGRVIASNNDNMVGQNHSDEGYFKGAKAIGMKGRESVYVQDIYYNAHLKALTMAFSAPIIKDGKFIGAAVLVVGMDQSFYPIFAGWPGMRPSGDTIICRIENGYLVYLNRLRFMNDAPLKLRFKLQNAPRPGFLAASGREGVMEGDDYRGKEVLAVYRYIPETKWGFVVKEDYDDAFAPVYALRRKVAYTMGFTVILVIFLVYVISSKIAEPITSMSKTSRRIAEGDFSVNLPVDSVDEINTLALSLNEMAASLKAYRSEVDKKNEELERANTDLKDLTQSLEEKVKGRTIELEELNRALLSMMEDLDERTEALEASQVELKKFADEVEESRNRIRENLEIVERANVELRRIDRMKDHFLGMMSHELRTPLSLITGYSSNLMSDQSIKIDPKVAEALDGIYKGAERLRMIITEMLDVSQIDAKGLRLTFTPTNIGDLVEEVVKELSTFIRSRNQEISLEDHAGLPQVAIDRKRMRQVLVNIIGNAIKFTPDGGKITVSFKRFKTERTPAKGPLNYLDIVIKDSGIGLDKEELGRIFEKFYEVGEIDKHSTSKYAYLGRGVGLGLPIARGIVEAHGGTLWAESSGYDADNCPGSSFHIVLPVSVQTGELATMGLVAETAEGRPAHIAGKDNPGAAEAVPAPPEPASPPVRKPKILLIEDDIDILNLTARLLRDQYETMKAEGGKEGIELAREILPDLILLDVYMEDMTGYDVCEILKSDQNTKDIPIAMFTAGAQRWEVDKGYKSGADDYITKPFKPDELLAKIKELVQCRR
jgi:signal transduction histidine kinase/CheY-like chemotaxis protein/HAMP domain-containing protein